MRLNARTEEVSLKKLLSPFLLVPVLTLIFLIGVDVLLRQGNVVDALGFRSVDLWNLPERLELARKTNPDVALIGSSLLLVLNQDDKGTHFYSGVYPPYLQQELRKTTGQKVTCVNLCSGLQMVSESYLISEALANSKDHPKVIIYGLSLRDFIHDQYAREWTTDSFASIAPYVPINFSVISHISSPHALGELLLDHYWYLYRDRTDFKNLFSGLTKDLLENLGLDEPFFRLGRFDHQWRAQKDGFLVENWVARKQEKFTEEVFRTRPLFLKRYYMAFQSQIYKQGKLETMEIQTGYLRHLINLCKEKNIKLVLVNMPLSPEIQPLVPEGLYEDFTHFITGLSRESNVAMLDLYGKEKYGVDSFKDGVHLNYPGARQLADELVAELKSNYPDVLAAMTEHAQARAKYPNLAHEGEAPYQESP
jgi:hypothetical protein